MKWILILMLFGGANGHSPAVATAVFSDSGSCHIAGESVIEARRNRSGSVVYICTPTKE